MLSRPRKGSGSPVDTGNTAVGGGEACCGRPPGLGGLGGGTGVGDVRCVPESMVAMNRGSPGTDPPLWPMLPPRLALLGAGTGAISRSPSRPLPPLGEGEGEGGGGAAAIITGDAAAACRRCPPGLVGKGSNAAAAGAVACCCCCCCCCGTGTGEGESNDAQAWVGAEAGRGDGGLTTGAPMAGGTAAASCSSKEGLRTEAAGPAAQQKGSIAPSCTESAVPSSAAAAAAAAANPVASSSVEKNRASAAAPVPLAPKAAAAAALEEGVGGLGGGVGVGGDGAGTAAAADADAGATGPTGIAPAPPRAASRRAAADPGSRGLASAAASDEAVPPLASADDDDDDGGGGALDMERRASSRCRCSSSSWVKRVRGGRGAPSWRQRTWAST